jgi:aryl-alcohol dehydrogenase-like predicted oxidoreductase
VIEACEAALKRLRTDYLDLYFCHRPDKETPIEETVWTMHNLIQQGKILYWGTSEWSAQEIMDAHRIAERYNLIGPTMEQPQYNMLVRQKVEVEFAQIYKTVGLGTTIWSPLASGILTGKYSQANVGETRLKRDELSWLAESMLTDANIKKVEQLSGIAAELEMSLPVLGVAWCLKNENVSSVILGASRAEQLVENLQAVDLYHRLTADVMDRIEAILVNRPKAPAF